MRYSGAYPLIVSNKLQRLNIITEDVYDNLTLNFTQECTTNDQTEKIRLSLKFQLNRNYSILLTDLYI